MSATENSDALSLLMTEETNAWFEYLESTRGQQDMRYIEVEPWAWAKLVQRLRAIKAKRVKLRGD